MNKKKLILIVFHHLLLLLLLLLPMQRHRTSGADRHSGRAEVRTCGDADVRHLHASVDGLRGGSVDTGGEDPQRSAGDRRTGDDGIRLLHPQAAQDNDDRSVSHFLLFIHARVIFIV
jgi:hypothetical protein